MTFITNKTLHRRTFLRGVGATVALPHASRLAHICARTATVAYASTVPITLISRGISFWITGATVTGTAAACGASRCDCWAELPKHAGSVTAASAATNRPSETRISKNP